MIAGLREGEPATSFSPPLLARHMPPKGDFPISRFSGRRPAPGRRSRPPRATSRRCAPSCRRAVRRSTVPPAYGHAATRQKTERMDAMKLRVGRREVNVSNPDKVFFPERRLKKIDLVEYYLDIAPSVLNHVQRRPMQMLRLPGRRGGVVLLPEARAEESPGLARDGAHRVPVGPDGGLPGRERGCGAGLDREPRLHRPAYVALAGDRRRPAGLPADRPRPERGQPVAARAEDRARRQGRDGRARAEELPEDVRVDRAPHPRADQAGARFPRSAAAGEGDGAGGRAPDRRPAGGDDDLEGGRSARRVRRLRPELAGPDDRVGVLDQADRGCAGLGAARLGRGSDGQAGAVHVDDDAEADRRGRRSDQGDVALQAQPDPALLEARPGAR